MSGACLFVIAAPSGAGKTSLVDAVVRTLPGIKVSVSHTTRAPRAGEVDGESYHFVDSARFQRMIAAGELLEYATVFGRSYGTSRVWVEQQLRSDTDVILEIDWQGARQIRTSFADARSIFILPPTLPALRVRLEARAQDSTTVIETRMAQALEQLAHHAEFDYLVVNDDFDQAVADLAAIIRACRLERRCQQRKLAPLLASLQQA